MVFKKGQLQWIQRSAWKNLKPSGCKVSLSLYNPYKKNTKGWDYIDLEPNIWQYYCHLFVWNLLLECMIYLLIPYTVMWYIGKKSRNYIGRLHTDPLILYIRSFLFIRYHIRPLNPPHLFWNISFPNQLFKWSLVNLLVENATESFYKNWITCVVFITVY